MTDFLQVANRAESTLDGGIDDTATSMTVVADTFPVVPFHVTLEDEIVRVTEKAALVFTIVREQEGTTKDAHADGTAVRLHLTAAVIKQTQDHEALTDVHSISRTATYVVAASDAPAHVKAQADYVCDGTADDVEIQAAIDAAVGNHGEVLVTGFNVHIAATVIVKCVGNFTCNARINAPAGVTAVQLGIAEAAVAYSAIYIREIHGSGKATAGDGILVARAAHNVVNVQYIGGCDVGIRFDADAAVGGRAGENRVITGQIRECNKGIYFSSSAGWMEGNVIITTIFTCDVGIEWETGGDSKYTQVLGCVDVLAAGAGALDFVDKVGSHMLIPLFWRPEKSTIRGDTAILSPKGSSMDAWNWIHPQTTKPVVRHDGTTHDWLTAANTGSGAVIQTLLNTRCYTGTTSGSTSRQYQTTDSAYFSPVHSTTLKYALFKAALLDTADVEAWLVITSEGTAFPVDTGKKVGFKWAGGELFAHCADGTAATNVKIADADTSRHLLEHRYNGTGIDFYYDGNLVTTITTNLPAHTNFRFMMAVKNSAAANKRLMLHNFDVCMV